MVLDCVEDPYEFESEEFHLPDPESFDKLSTGLQIDGTVLFDLGWAGAHYIWEMLGIENIVGFSGFKSEHHFLSWVRENIGLRLADWEALTITLYQCWYPPVFETDSFCYMGWRADPCKSAIRSFEFTVFAIKHKSFKLKEEYCFSAFKCARLKSLAGDVLASKNNNEVFTPSHMNNYLDSGYYLTGKGLKDDASKTITWPTHDLVAVLAELDKFHSCGYTDLHCWCEDVGFSFKDLTAIKRKRLLNAYFEYGADTPFFDLLKSAGF